MEKVSYFADVLSGEGPSIKVPQSLPGASSCEKKTPIHERIDSVGKRMLAIGEKVRYILF